MKKRRRSPLTYAKLQLAGGVPWGEVIVGQCSLYVCQKCRTEYHLDDGTDSCAFCNDCKDHVLDTLAARVVVLEAAATARATRRGRRSSKFAKPRSRSRA